MPVRRMPRKGDFLSRASRSDHTRGNDRQSHVSGTEPLPHNKSRKGVDFFSFLLYIAAVPSIFIFYLFNLSSSLW